MSEKITLYTSRSCPHSWAVERFLRRHQVPVNQINIDDDPVARETLISLNNGYASVPTLMFPDGTQLTEPSLGQLRARLGIESSGVLARIRAALGL